MSIPQTMPEAATNPPADHEKIFELCRRWGYLQAALDPLGHMPPEPHSELKLTGKTAEEARAIYCGPIGAEFMHLPQPERRLWVQDHMEERSPKKAPDAARILQRLIRSDVVEPVIQPTYL